jgi:hypothetical protein
MLIFHTIINMFCLPVKALLQKLTVSGLKPVSGYFPISRRHQDWTRLQAGWTGQKPYNSGIIPAEE